MKNNKRKGFTIVELVIVIAVIAILAAVLIPTFSNLIDKANVSSDKQLAKNMNTALAIAEADGNTPADLSAVLTIVNKSGYVVENLNPTSEGYYFAWDKSTNQILFVNSENDFAVEFPESDFSTNKNDWRITVGSKAEAEKIGNAGIGIYLENDISEAIVLTNWVSVDTGVMTLAELSVSGSGATTIDLIGQFGKVTVNNGDGSVNNKGAIGELTITAIADACFNNYGSIITVTDVADGALINKGVINTITDVKADARIENEGKIVAITITSGAIENKGTITTIATINAAATVINKGNIGTVATNNGSINNADGYLDAVTTGTEPTGKAAGTGSKIVLTTNVIEIGTATELQNIAYMVNGGADYSDMVISLTADIDLTGRTWTPIGEKSASKFKGTFNGNNHKIIGLSDSGYVGGETFTNGSTQTTGERFGLFAFISGNSTIENITLENVSISGANRNKSAALVGEINGGTVVISNISVSGSISGIDKLAGIIGEIRATVTVKNCVNNATITAVNNTSAVDKAGASCRAGGIVAQIAESYTVTIDNCKNNGNISATGIAVANGGCSDKYLKEDSPVCAGGLIGLDNASNVNKAFTTITASTNSGVLSAKSLKHGSIPNTAKEYYGGQTGSYFGRQNVSLNKCVIDGVEYTPVNAMKPLEPGSTETPSAWITKNNSTLNFN